MQNFGPAAVEIDINGDRRPGGIERRRYPRHRVSKSAAIVFGNDRRSIGCQILDVSESGAMLMPVDAALCPREFLLKPSDGGERNCEVVWRTGTKIGVKYFSK